MSQTGSHRLSKLGLMAKNHMRTHRPEMFKALQEAGALDEVLYEMQSTAAEAMRRTREKLKKENPPPKTERFLEIWRYNQWVEDTAWEMVRDMILLPEGDAEATKSLTNS